VPLQVDDYRRNRETGSLILVDEATNETLAAGMIEDVHSADNGEPGADAASGRSPNVTWDSGALTRERRWSSLGTRGATVWMTGLPASGKSTIAAMVEERLVASGVPAYRLDGDNLRHGLNGNLGFSAEDRAENVRRAAHAARLLADSGTVAIVSLVSPYAADRELARKIHEDEGLDFVEVFVNTPLEECERRDPKGLYARARSGELRGMTGVDDPYERPATPDLELATAGETAEALAERLVSLLAERGVR
jgi:bifunctional enzyme CysN/CysC